MAGYGGGDATPLLSRHSAPRFLGGWCLGSSGSSGSVVCCGSDGRRLRLATRENRQERQIDVVVRFADLLRRVPDGLERVRSGWSTC